MNSLQTSKLDARNGTFHDGNYSHERNNQDYNSEWFSQQSELIEVREALQQSQAKQIDLLKRSREAEMRRESILRDLMLVEGILHAEAETVAKRLRQAQKMLMHDTGFLEGPHRADWRSYCSDIHRSLQVILGHQES